jgi:hypothetical protein
MKTAERIKALSDQYLEELQRAKLADQKFVDALTEGVISVQSQRIDELEEEVKKLQERLSLVQSYFRSAMWLNQHLIHRIKALYYGPAGVTQAKEEGGTEPHGDDYLGPEERGHQAGDQDEQPGKKSG